MTIYSKYHTFYPTSFLDSNYEKIYLGDILTSILTFDKYTVIFDKDLEEATVNNDPEKATVARLTQEIASNMLVKERRENRGDV